MHKKVEHLFAQKIQRQDDIRQNKLPLPLLSLLFQILFNVDFSIHIYIKALLSRTLSVTFSSLFIFFDRNFY